MNHLARHNEARKIEIEAIRDQIRVQRKARSAVSMTDYASPALERRIAEALADHLALEGLEPQFELIERDKLGGDLALKFPQLLKKGGPKRFIADDLPQIVARLSADDFSDTIARIDTKGMYINLTLTDRWLLQSAQSVADHGDGFGLNDTAAGTTHVVDYSSPNIAKVLHAGHIRSTIIGHVLSNLLDACGALVYRVNHVNDFGGFGFLLEGYRRFAGSMPDGLSENGKLLEIYRIRRAVERIVAGEGDFASLGSEERDLVRRYFPGVDDRSELAEAFQRFVQASDRRFADLETGAVDEVELWSKMVGFSLSDFDDFYDALNLRIDFAMGESFYLEMGDRVVDEALERGVALIFREEDAAMAIAAIEASVADGTVERVEADGLVKGVEKDVGAVVVPLCSGERLVVRRADGRSIYATRDIGAIAVRNAVFEPSDVTYVVGQEQRVHFARLFDAARQIGLVKDGLPSLTHVYFGFYVDTATGKKLSSRDSVSNVMRLLELSADYFRRRLSDRVEQNDDEIRGAARELSIGSLVFNDLKQDIKGSVDIDVADIEATVAGFERSGGAYVVYSACRARSILRRHGRKPTPASDIGKFQIDGQEALLLLKVQQTPSKVAQAARQNNPSVLIRHLLEVAMVYNSYYARAPVIVEGEADPARLLITQAVQIALTNGLALCHVRCPAVI